MEKTKQERLDEFFRRLQAEPITSSFDESLEQIIRILNGVEDEWTTIPYNPESWHSDGRLYPPQPDSLREVKGHPNVKRLRSRGHNTFVGENGAIEIRTSKKEIIFSKEGSNGKGVWEE